MTMPASADHRPNRSGPAHTRPDHDETLIAGLAAGDLTDGEAAAAGTLVATCPACAELHSDLLSIMAATTTLPAPRRTRDFRLTEADAARLLPRRWRRFVGPFAGPRLASSGPLAGGLVALGIAGLLLAAMPGFLTTSNPTATSAPLGPAAVVPGASEVGSGAFGGAADAAAPTAEPAASGAGPAALPSGNRSVAGFVASAAPPTSELGPVESTAGVPASTAAPASPATPLLAGSVVLLAAGLGLFALRWMARRPG